VLQQRSVHHEHFSKTEYTWCRGPLDQRLLIDFCIISALAPLSVGCSCQKRAELLTDRRLQNLKITSGEVCRAKTWRAKRSYQIKWETLLDNDVTKTCADCVLTIVPRVLGMHSGRRRGNIFKSVVMFRSVEEISGFTLFKLKFRFCFGLKASCSDSERC